MHHRNAASVLPDPVGAQMSVCPPAVMAGQPCACAAVGAANDDSNQERVAGEKAASGDRERGTGAEYKSVRESEQLV